MKGFNIAERGHVVLATAPVDLNGGVVNSDVFSLGKYAHADIIVGLGVTGAATTITVEECDNFTPSNTTAIAFEYYEELTAAGDTLSTASATTAGITGSTNDGVIYVISIDAAQLTDGRPNLRVVFSDPAAATLATVVAILSGARYQQEATPTAIA